MARLFPDSNQAYLIGQDISKHEVGNKFEQAPQHKLLNHSTE